MGPFLRVARVREEPAGVVRVDVPAGPARDRVVDSTARRALADALSAGLKRRVDVILEVRGSASDAEETAPRVTPEAVRSGRLRELLEREPLLEHAVEELDLEILE
jgi:hypothetical protein